jgi:hypothetical protein
MTYEFQGRTRARVEEESGRRRSRPRTSPAAAGPEVSPGPGRPGRPGREPRQPIHAFAATMGLAFLLIGIVGFIPGITTHYGQLGLKGPDSHAELFGLFEVSVLHNVAHLLFGVGVIAAARVSWSRIYLVGGGLAYLALTAYGAVADRASNANFLPFNRADNILHLVLSLLMIALGVVGTRLSRGRS